MDLETAIDQRNGYLMLINNMNIRLAYAQRALDGLPTIPTTQHDIALKNQILKDLNQMNGVKNKADGKVTLLRSRIEFIENNIKK
jgi:hypothetical protein